MSVVDPHHVVNEGRSANTSFWIDWIRLPDRYLHEEMSWPRPVRCLNDL